MSPYLVTISHSKLNHCAILSTHSKTEVLLSRWVPTAMVDVLPLPALGVVWTNLFTSLAAVHGAAATGGGGESGKSASSTAAPACAIGRFAPFVATLAVIDLVCADPKKGRDFSAFDSLETVTADQMEQVRGAEPLSRASRASRASHACLSEFLPFCVQSSSTFLRAYLLAYYAHA